MRNDKSSSPGKIRQVKQVDLTPTLALLTGVSIPGGNIGRPLTEVLSHMGLERRMMLHHIAAKQLLAIARGSGLFSGNDNAELIFEEATRLHKQVLQNDILEAERVCRFYQECQEMVSDALSSKLQSYDLTAIFASTMAVILVRRLGPSASPGWSPYLFRGFCLVGLQSCSFCCCGGCYCNCSCRNSNLLLFEAVTVPSL
ncbi:uncharacterized protein LOC119574923 [Penaeus monodon]|uniref:uncharacterized protein LOC119574923 n=1 Tax=Penaeus monodon TaxID=6687 RepID=UPI0018A73D67|nr:uncharacterized protein LOC119574923 [Penaeus monodon]